ncbi:MAG: phosphonate ABC transporter, permease protein PhnE [Candidatus Omnitrophica bacterium]|nr:phosphonate ABC transporter, permease protein PhnE [Candidatus Omnitrophota bacterium]
MSQEVLHFKMVSVPAIRGQMEEQFRNLVATVEKITGYKIDVHESLTYQDAINVLKSGNAQIGWLGPQVYLESAHDADIEAFAVAMRGKEQHSTYRTLFVARMDSKIENLKDLKGNRLTLSQKGSTSGDLMPRHELLKNGLDPDSSTCFAQIIYSGSHEGSVASVLSGTSDVAAVSEINFEAMVAQGVLDHDKVKVIHTSPAIPGAPLVYSKKLPKDVREKIKEAVLNAHKHGKVSGYGQDIVKYETQEEARKEFLASYLKPQWGWKSFVTLGIFFVVMLAIFLHLKIDLWESLGDSVKYMGDLMSRLFPPDFSDLPELLIAMVETIEIGFLGTLLAIVLALPVGLLAARNIAPNKFVYYIARTITIFFRSIPEFIIAMILVIAIGFGALPGVLALGFHTMGFLAKFYAEEMEHVATGPIEALEATGARPSQIVMFAIIPQIVPSFVGFSLYVLDRNIRMATMLGIVGAGGIGYRLQSSFRMFHYKEVTAIIIIIFATIYLIDIVSSKLRLSIK